MKISSKIQMQLNQTQLSFLENFFLSCPDDIASCIYLKSFSQNQALINSDDGCSNVYILLEGRLQAIEEHIGDTDFRFLNLNAIEIVGDFELFSQQSTRLVTLLPLESSLCLVIPASDYLHWIKDDAHALYIRLQMLTRQLTMQTQTERKQYFMDNRTHLLNVFYNEYVAAAPTPMIIISKTRDTLASHVGCSTRTINRVIHFLQDTGLISIKRGKIHISKKQFEHIERILLNETSGL